jgi:hypothetical protein
MKKYIIVALGIALFVAWFISDDSIETTQEKPVQSVASDQSNFSIISPHSSTSQSSSISSQGQSSQPTSSSSVWAYQEPLESKTWRNSRGIFHDEELIEYEGFKLDKLEELASRGDLKAIKVLSKYEFSSGNTKRFRELVDLGAVHGSLDSLRHLGAEKIGNYFDSRKEEDALEMLAYMEFQGKRGDLFIKSKIPVVYKIHNFYPTQEQAEYIDRRSDELMADFEKRRKEMGLPPFDNSTLASDRELFDDD